MENTLKGAAARAVIQGNSRTAMVVGVAESHRWENGQYTDELDGVVVEVVSPATRYRKIGVKVPPEGFTLGFQDEYLEAIVEAGGSAFPLVGFEGLQVSMYSRKDSRAINYAATADSVFLCDDSGKPLK